MDGYFFFPSPRATLRALALLQPERFPVPGAALGSCHWHRPFITIKMQTDFSFIQDIFLPVPMASGMTDTFQASAGCEGVWF